MNSLWRHAIQFDQATIVVLLFTVVDVRIDDCDKRVRVCRLEQRLASGMRASDRFFGVRHCNSSSARAKQWGVRYGLFAAAFFLAWFSAVDISIFDGRCAYCDMNRATFEARLLGISLGRLFQSDSDDHLARMACDLGKPCQHDFERLHVIRFRGCLIPGRPWHRGTSGLTGGIEYDAEFGDRAIRFGKKHPEIADEFYAWLQTEVKDYGYYQALLAQIKRQ